MKVCFPNAKKKIKMNLVPSYFKLERTAKELDTPMLRRTFYSNSRNSRTISYYMKDGIVHIHGARRDDQKCMIKHVVLSSSVDDCKCDLYVHLREEKFNDKPDFKVSRYVRGRRRNEWAMYFALCVKIKRAWMLKGTRVVRINLPKEEERVESIMRRQKCQNQIEIPHYFHSAGHSNSSFLVTPAHMVTPLRMFDAGYLRRLCPEFYNQKGPLAWANFLRKNIWQEVRLGPKVVLPGVAWTNTSVQKGKFFSPVSLYILAMRTVSLSNSAIGGNSIGPNASYTCTNIGDKQLERYKKMQGPTHKINPLGRAASKLIPQSISLLRKLMKVEKYKASREFAVTDEMLDEMHIPNAASPGRRSGPQRVFKGKFFDVRVTVNGSKITQRPYSMRGVKNMIDCFKNNMKWNAHDRAWVITFKSEVLFAKTFAEQRKLMKKIRIYFIPTTFQYIVAALVSGMRQKLERGGVIRIGMTFFFGGANEFARFFKWKNKAMRYFQADFSGLDTTIKYHLLMMYVYSTMYYYKKSGEYGLLKYLVGQAADNLSAKVTNVYGNIWRMMFGVMPSGAYETSHGDSWIVALLYCQYFLVTLQQHPHRREEVMKGLLELEVIIIAIYGDDSVLGVHKDTADIINIFGFGKFCADYYDMTLRDEELFYSFISVPNLITGETLVNGVTFLQRQFILSSAIDNMGYDLPEVLPYRSMKKIVQKSIYGSGDLRGIDEHIVSSIGLAYDTMGTNKLAYNYTKYVYHFLTRQFKRTIVDICNDKDVMKNKSILKLLRKSRITLTDLRQGFPSLSRLMSMHVDDPDKRVMEHDVFL